MSGETLMSAIFLAWFLTIGPFVVYALKRHEPRIARAWRRLQERR